ncbi:MAG: hypothetical protein M1838_001386 [Thelocarpon superellum]|nr:MAG: hypothetical protein M1838_001386 [Thelocarpon superellum]
MTTTAPLPATPAHQLSSTFGSSSREGWQDASAPSIPRGPVISTLNFYTAPADGSKPYNWVEKQAEGVPQRNYTLTPTEVQLTDIRGREEQFSLDNNAFEAISNVAPSAERDFADDEHIKQVYYPEIEKLLLDNVPGSHRVFLFDHTIRRAGTNRTPVMVAHVDQTGPSTAARVRLHLPDEADTLLAGRYRIINVWRPLNGPVVSSPLGFADSSSAAEGDLVGVEHRYPDRTGETAGVKHSAGQRWHYWSGMQNDERLLLKCYDSDPRVAGRERVPHSAFTHPRTPEGAPERESIEVRALVFG